MEEPVMEKLVLINEVESAAVYGGRNENLANIVEIVAQCAGAFAKLVYLVINRGGRQLAMQSANGYYFKW